MPIEIRALKTASVYIVDTSSHRFLIDSGMRPTTEEVLKSHGVDTSSIDGVLITHLHIDHIGGAMSFKKNHGSSILMGRRDAELCQRIGENHGEYLGFLESYYKENGMPSAVLEPLIRDHPMHWEFMNYSEFEVDEMLEDGSSPLGDQELRILGTPGHSPGSISPYFEKGEVFAGDHVLGKITPNISFYDYDSDMLSIYIESLKKMKEMPFTRINPGHGEPFSNLNSRIDQIIEHHRLRLDEVNGIIKNDWITAFDVTSRMKWSKGRSFESMNQFEKNFAFGEAIAHLRKLVSDNSAEKKEQNGLLYFRSS